MSKRDAKYPALMLPGRPEVLYIPKVRLEVDGHYLTADALIRLRTGRRMDWVLVEVDEGGVVTAESRRREELLGLPTLRVTEDDLLRHDFVQHLIRSAQRLLGLPAMGYVAPGVPGGPGHGGRGAMVRPPLVRPRPAWKPGDGDWKRCS